MRFPGPLLAFCASLFLFVSPAVLLAQQSSSTCDLDSQLQHVFALAAEREISDRIRVSCFDFLLGTYLPWLARSCSADVVVLRDVHSCYEYRHVKQGIVLKAVAAVNSFYGLEPVRI